MLSCSVVLRPKRTVAATADEPGAADDSFNVLGLGHLVQEAASAHDTVGLAGGSVTSSAIVETASAADISSATFSGVFEIIEPTSAAAAQDANLVTAVATVAETATASSTEDAATVGVPTTATWDPATVANVTLSAGNLVATNTGTTSLDQGARVGTSAVKQSGKYYFEDTFTVVTPPAGGTGPRYGIGVGTTASTYTDIGGVAVGGVLLKYDGNIYANGSYTGITVLGISGAFTTICVAVDLDNRKIWFRHNAGIWNENASYDPAANVGGITIPAGDMVPFATFGGAALSNGQVQTANFGGSTFADTVPSGFESGWSKFARLLGTVTEAASAADAPDATGGTALGGGHTAMLLGVMVNAGNSRQANVDGVMLNM